MHSSFAGRRCWQRPLEVKFNRYRFCFLLMPFFSKAFSTPGIATLITRSATTSFGLPPRLPHGVFNLGRGHAVDGCLPSTSRRRGNRRHGDGHTSMPPRSRYRKIINKYEKKDQALSFFKFTFAMLVQTVELTRCCSQPSCEISRTIVDDNGGPTG